MELLCPWESAQYFIYSSNIPTLFFYSHIPATIVALAVGFLVFYKSGKSKVGTTLLAISLLFSLWSVFDLILWATNRPDIVMFFWSLQILIEPLIYMLGFYLTYLFVANKDLGFKAKLLGLLICSPIVFFLSFSYNLVGVDLAYCTAIEGIIAKYFTYIVELTFIVAILLLTTREYRKNSDKDKKKEILTFGLGVTTFLLAFSWGNLIGSFTENWTLAQAGLVGMPVFVGFLAYLIVRFQTFDIKLIMAQALVFTLGFFILAISFIRRIENVRIVVFFTLAFVIILGRQLIREVKKEVEQNKELGGVTEAMYKQNLELARLYKQVDSLNKELEESIKQRESLVHLVTHKVKGSFTHSKYIFASLLDGTFGEVSPEIKKVVEKGLESDNMGIETVDLVLNVANMEKGIVKYDMQKVDLKEITLNAVEEKKDRAETKGLRIENEIKFARPHDGSKAGGDGVYNVLGDVFWLKEAVSNLIENSIKYTKTGKITVGLENRNSKILLSVKDTGVGITEEDKKSLFTEGGRGKDSVKVNVDSTGYGLYSVKLIIAAHKGRVWAESEGADKGSTFFIELPAV